MTLGKVIVLAIIGILAAFFVAFALPMAHARAAELCAYTITSVSEAFKADRTDMVSFVVLDDPLSIKAVADALAPIGFTVPASTTRVMLAIFKNGAHDFGLEVDGCLSPPYRWPEGIAWPLASA